MVIFKKEKEVIELIATHADTVESCLLTGINALEAYLKDNMSMAKVFGRQVDDLEGKADLVRHEIRDKLYSGAYMPLIREDIYKLVEGMDKVANAGEACCDFFLNQRPEIPDALCTPFTLIVKESLVSGSLSTPLPLSANRLPLTGVCSSVSIRSSSAMGSSFNPVMVTVTVAVSVPPLPSSMV